MILQLTNLTPHLGGVYHDFFLAPVAQNRGRVLDDSLQVLLHTSPEVAADFLLLGVLGPGADRDLGIHRIRLEGNERH